MGVEERTAARTPAPEQVIRVRQRPCVCDLTSRSCEPEAPLRPTEDPSSSRTGVCGGGFSGSSEVLCSLSGIRGDSLVELVPGLWFPGLWVRLVPTEKAVIVETSIQSPPSPPTLCQC